MSTLEPVLVSVSGEEFFSWEDQSSGSNDYSIVEELEAAVLLLFSEGFIDISRVARGGIEGIDLNDFSCSGVYALYSIIYVTWHLPIEDQVGLCRFGGIVGGNNVFRFKRSAGVGGEVASRHGGLANDEVVFMTS